MADKASTRWAKAFAVLFVGGFAIGALGGMFSDTTEMFITDTLSYNPSEQWWLNGLLWGVQLVIVAAAAWGAGWLCVVLLRHGLLFLVVGGMIVAGGLFMLWVGFTLDSLDGGQRILFRWILGPFALLIGGPMLWAGFRGRSARRGT